MINKLKLNLIRFFIDEVFSNNITNIKKTIKQIIKIICKIKHLF